MAEHLTNVRITDPNYFTISGSANTIVGVNSSAGIHEYKVLAASDNATVIFSGTGIFISAITNAGGSTNTASLVQSSRTITAGSGLSGGGDLSTDRSFSVNTNVRDKAIGFFFAGSLSSLMMATSAMIYIPFNMELRSIQLAVSHSAGGQNIMIQPTLWSGNLQANSAMFNAAVRPVIVTNSLVGSSNTLGSTVLNAGSFLGVQIDSVGTTVIASNLTVTFIVRTS